MFSDFNYIFIWWLTIFVLGSLSLPLTFNLFNKFWDKGYIFSKTISLIILTYLILVLGIFKIIPFTTIGIYLLISVFILFDLCFLSKHQRLKKFLLDLKKNYKTILLQESAFFLVLLIWSYIRGFNPDIEGLEKYMDWGFVNSAMRSQFLPPQDMWFAGEIINYYYFGHLIFALITKISSVISSVGYNLSIATVCALTFTSTFSLVSNITFLSFFKKNKAAPCPVKGDGGCNSSPYQRGIRGLREGFCFKKIITAGLISALLLTFGGNLHSLYKISKINYQQNQNHLVLTKEAISKSVSAYWYPDATRFIGHDPDTNDKTIHEFPLYSFVVADLHGHMNDIFIVIFFLAFLFISLFESDNRRNWKFIIGSGFVLSVCYMTNAWDFAVYGLVLAIFSFFFNFQKSGSASLIKTIFNGLLVIVFWYLFSYPFSLKFIPMMEGIKISDGHSPFYQLFVLYGGFWLICFPFLFGLIYKLVKPVIRQMFFKHINQLTWPKIKNSLTPSDLFIISLIIAATVLVLIPEFIYIKDIYIYEHRRANTMFKLVYQAFILYSLSSGFVLIKINSFLKSKILRFLYYFCFLTVFVVHMIYPYFAIKSYYNSLKNYQGVDGLKYLEKLYPDNYRAIIWLNQHISGQPVILEAVGDSYTTFNQVSSATGLPTVQGWIVHEWLWRGAYDAPAARQAEVDKIFNFLSSSSDNVSEIKQLLSKYQVKYIFIGAKEHEKYPDLDLEKLSQIDAKIVFRSGQTTIYRL